MFFSRMHEMHTGWNNTNGKGTVPFDRTLSGKYEYINYNQIREPLATLPDAPKNPVDSYLQNTSLPNDRKPASSTADSYDASSKPSTSSSSSPSKLSPVSSFSLSLPSLSPSSSSPDPSPPFCPPTHSFSDAPPTFPDFDFRQSSVECYPSISASIFSKQVATLLTNQSPNASDIDPQAISQITD